MYYTATLMQQQGFSSRDSVFMSLVGGGSLLRIISAIFYTERFSLHFWPAPRYLASSSASSSPAAAS
jgi:hypothetical protein